MHSVMSQKLGVGGQFCGHVFDFNIAYIWKCAMVPCARLCHDLRYTLCGLHNVLFRYSVQHSLGLTDLEAEKIVVELAVNVFIQRDFTGQCAYSDDLDFLCIYIL